MAWSMRSLAGLVVGLAVACGHKDDAKPQPPEPPRVVPDAAIAPAAADASPAPVVCAPATIYLENDHLAYGRDHRIDLPARKDDIMNFSGLESGLKRLATECRGPVLIHAVKGAMYQDVIDAMDLATKAGFTDIAIDDGGATPALRTQPSSSAGAVASSPVLVITSTDLTLDGQVIAHTKDADVTAAVHTALTAKAPGAKGAQLILQADRGTSAVTINQVITGARGTGFDNVLFAVNSK